jgi:hypothetical protein
LATVRHSYQVMLATMLPRYAGGGTAGLTWPQHDVESCWRQYY